MSEKIVNKAEALATAAHQGQERKYTGEPYINHPAEVVALVRSVRHTPEMVAAAWLHDVVEDTAVPLTAVLEECGPVVASLVEQLTDASRPADGNRAVRKAIDREHTAQASPEAKTIKLADMISNTQSIVARDPKFARVYLKEKRALLEVLRDASSPELWTQADRLTRSGLALVNA